MKNNKNINANAVVMQDGNLYLPNHMIPGGCGLILENQMNDLVVVKDAKKKYKKIRIENGINN